MQHTRKGKRTQRKRKIAISCWLGKRKRKAKYQVQDQERTTRERLYLRRGKRHEGQWLELVDISLPDTWQTDSSPWDWYAENEWEEAAANYQDWETSQDWQSSASWLAVGSLRSGSSDSRDNLLSRTRGPSRRVSGQDDDYSQLFVEDVTSHYFLITRIRSVIDLAQNPTYVILDLVCTQ